MNNSAILVVIGYLAIGGFLFFSGGFSGPKLGWIASYFSVITLISSVVGVYVVAGWALLSNKPTEGESEHEETKKIFKVTSP